MKLTEVLMCSTTITALDLMSVFVRCSYGRHWLVAFVRNISCASFYVTLRNPSLCCDVLLDRIRCF